jgi:hypothetical protein
MCPTNLKSKILTVDAVPHRSGIQDVIEGFDFQLARSCCSTVSTGVESLGCLTRLRFRLDDCNQRRIVRAAQPHRRRRRNRRVARRRLSGQLVLHLDRAFSVGSPWRLGPDRPRDDRQDSIDFRLVRIRVYRCVDCRRRALDRPRCAQPRVTLRSAVAMRSP